MKRKSCLDLLLLALVCVGRFSVSAEDSSSDEFVPAHLNITIRDVSGATKSMEITGKYGTGALEVDATGYMIYEESTWCNNFTIRVAVKPWIALIKRGECYFNEKIRNAMRSNASAVIIYNDVPGEFRMKQDEKVVAVSIGQEYGEELVDSKRKGYTVYVRITPGPRHENPSWPSRTSVLFVLVSFILLMCISLAWLVFYYVQRFRYFYARDRKEKRLLNAAKKAISKLKTRSFAEGDEVDHDDTCAVCLENYKRGETLRVLPCRHDFHKQCIDPWLLEHRTCPMCKLNILKAMGLDMPEAGESTNIVVTNAVGTEERRGSHSGSDISLPLGNEDEHNGYQSVGTNDVSPSTSPTDPSSELSHSTVALVVHLSA